MTSLFINYFAFLLIIYFNGKIFLIFFNDNIKNLSIFEQSIVGLIVTGFIAQIINFFLPLNNFVLYTNFIIIFFYITFNLKKITNLKLLFSYTSVSLFFFTILIIYGSSFSDDLNHYHYGSIINSDKHNLIVGMNSLHSLYGFSSMWLTLHSYLNFDYSRLQDIHILNGLSLFIFLSFLSYEIISEVKKKKKDIYLPILLFILIFVLIKYTRLKEFGIDRSSFLIFFYVILFYVKHVTLNLNKGNTDEFKISIFLLLSFFCTFLFFVKIIFIFSLILPFAVFLGIKKKIFVLKNPLIYFLGLIYLFYFTKNFLISGCLIYPLEPLCFSQLPWYEAESIRSINFNTEVFNKSFFQYNGNLTQDEYIKNFHWIKTWIQRNAIELIEFLITLILIFIINILIFKKKINSNYSKKINSLFPLVIIFIFSFLLILLKTPVIRMSHHIFVLFFVIMIIKYFNEHVIIANKKIFFCLIIVAFTFNISKNLLRIKSSNFINDPIYVLKKNNLYSEAKKNNLGDFVYYQGWIGGHPIGNSNLDNYNYKRWFIFDIIFKND